MYINYLYKFCYLINNYKLYIYYMLGIRNIKIYMIVFLRRNIVYRKVDM